MLLKLIFKNGETKEINHPNTPDILYWNEPEQFNILEYIELTPDNIIKYSGFNDSYLEKLNIKKTEFQLAYKSYYGKGVYIEI